MIEIEKLINNNIDNLKKIINNLIKNTFIKLDEKQKILLSQYLFKITILFIIYFFDEKIIEQLTINNCQDIYSLLILFLPYYDVNKSNDLESLTQLISNSQNNSQKFVCTYYVDHNNISLQKYFKLQFYLIHETFKKCNNKILPNWVNIYPYSMINYKNSILYKNFILIFNDINSFYNNILKYEETSEEENDIKEKKDEDIKELELNDLINISKNIFLLGIDTLYGCIYSFLYNDIKNIKWMIFDNNYDNKEMLPYIIIIGNELNINNIASTTFKQINETDKLSILKNWSNFISLPKNYDIIISLILFFLRYEKNSYKIKDFNLDPECLKYLKKFILNEDITEFDENLVFNKNDNKFRECIINISSIINFEELYMYIFKCMQQFRYTWYGFKLLDDKHNIKETNVFYNTYITDLLIIDKIKPKLYYITPKIIYNFFKSMVNKNYNNNNKKEYNLISSSSQWCNVSKNSKYLFLNRLIDELDSDQSKWFNIPKNLKRMYPQLSNTYINNINNFIYETIKNSNLFADIIFETLIYNGILTYFKFNPIITNKNIVPNKNKVPEKEWRSYLIDNINLSEFSNCYNFLSNKKYEFSNYNLFKPTRNNSFISVEQNSLEIVKNSLWFMGFGANMIAQIQIYHHIINQRVIYVTGATGVGKSTIAPMSFLYAYKIIFYNNNGKIICTVPRTKPAVDNAKQIATSFGVPYVEEIISNKKVIEIPSNINYVQYNYKDSEFNFTDDYYHPILRLVTDGLILKTIKNNYIYKKSDYKDPTKFTSKNLFDMILVDEAHEHNVNMDFILTLAKYSIYINNQVSLGIISATMEEDEPKYRKFYEIIDDNKKFPFNLDILSEDIDVNIIDRRINLSEPFGGMNFDVKQFTILNTKIIDILKIIFNNSNTGDILIFQEGQNEINFLINEVNLNSPSNVLAIPFYTTMNKEQKNLVENIANQQVRNKFIYPKNQYNINDINDIPQSERLPPGFYKRFIIIATNIAEASITIRTLKFVIDNGKQKIKLYNVETNTESIKVKYIAKVNQKQRKGRVGRVSTGTVYYTYPEEDLEQIIYKICTDNITDSILELLSENKTYFIDSKNDPNNVNKLELIPDILKEQYTYINFDTKFNLFSYRKKNLLGIKPIIYPNIYGKYSKNELVDEKGDFYLVHPDEDVFKRNINMDIINIKTIFDKVYKNKVQQIIDYNTNITKYLDNNGNFTTYGELIINLCEFLDLESYYIRLLLTVLSYNFKTSSELVKNIIIFIIFKKQNISLRFPKYISGNADFLIKASTINSSYFNLPIENQLNGNLMNINNFIKTYLIQNIGKTIIDENIFLILYYYYVIKIKLNIILNTNKINFNNNEINLNLSKINIKNNSKPDYFIYYTLKKFNQYEQMSYFIINNFPNNILIKVPDSNYYVSYFQPNVNIIYQLKSFLLNNKKNVDTKISNNFRNYIIFYLKEDIDLNISSIFWVPIDSLRLSIINNKNLFKIDNKINKDYMISIYNYNFENIFYNIDKVSSFLNKLFNKYKNNNFF